MPDSWVAADVGYIEFFDEYTSQYERYWAHDKLPPRYGTPLSLSGTPWAMLLRALARPAPTGTAPRTSGPAGADAIFRPAPAIGLRG